MARFGPPKPAVAAEADAFEHASRLHAEGRVAQAEAAYRRALALEPRHAGALHGLGVLALQQGRTEEGARLAAQACQADPARRDALLALAGAYRLLGRQHDALQAMQRALALRPDDTAVQIALDALRSRVAAGGAGTARPRAASPDAGRPTLEGARALHTLGEYDAAAQAYEGVVDADPRNIQALVSWAHALQQAARTSEALAVCERALAADPAAVGPLELRATLLVALGLLPEALAQLEAAVQAHDGHASLWNALGAVLQRLRRLDDALSCYQRALQLDATHLEALANFAEVLQLQHRFEDAALVYERLVQISPHWPFALGSLLFCKLVVCDWLALDELRERVEAALRAGVPAAEPFAMLAFCSDAALQRRCAEMATARLFPAQALLALPPAAEAAPRRLRIGYVSGEWRQQATSTLIVGLLEQHDRSRFDVFAFDAGHDDGSALRRRVAAAVDELVPIAALDDAQAAAEVLARGIDILVNLNGFFGNERNGLFALRPARVQVSYLGFPGTLGMPYIDYLLADRTVIPEHAREHYTEAVVHLPGSYQCNDHRRALPESTLARADVGLPEDAFVFCSFNNTFKILPEVFALWMRLLEQRPGSLLWLYANQAAAREHLATAAARHGIAQDRLVFAPHWPSERHLQRLPLADLFLDTLPCNAHTTASDALFAGLPMLTCIGSSFAGRVGASLLAAAGLPELIAGSATEYESLALQLAREPGRLALLRSRLESQRRQLPLFDTPRIRAAVEQAYLTMAERACGGLAPAPFAVRADDGEAAD